MAWESRVGVFRLASGQLETFQNQLGAGRWREQSWKLLDEISSFCWCPSIGNPSCRCTSIQGNGWFFALCSCAIFSLISFLWYRNTHSNLDPTRTFGTHCTRGSWRCTYTPTHWSYRSGWPCAQHKHDCLTSPQFHSILDIERTQLRACHRICSSSGKPHSSLLAIRQHRQSHPPCQGWYSMLRLPSI